MRSDTWFFFQDPCRYFGVNIQWKESSQRLIIYYHQKNILTCSTVVCNFDPSSHNRLDKVHLSMGKQSIWNDWWTETDQSVNHDNHSGSDVWNVQTQCMLPINFGYASSMSQPCPGQIIWCFVFLFLIHHSRHFIYWLLILLIQSAEHDGLKNCYQVPIGGK